MTYLSTLGRVTNSVAPGRTESTVYNTLGQVTLVLDAWIPKTFFYNNQGLLTVSSNALAATSSTTNSFTYDAAGHLRTLHRVNCRLAKRREEKGI